MRLQEPDLKKETDWQEFCTRTLMDTLGLPEHQRTLAWTEARTELLRLAEKCIARREYRRIVIADADLSNRELRGYNFNYCYIIRTIFKGADIRDATFQYSILRHGSLRDANSIGAVFSFADLQGTVVENLRYDSNSKFGFSIFRPSGPVSPQLEDRVGHDRAAVSSGNAPFLNKLLNVLTGYGFRIRPLLLGSSLVVFIFAILYRLSAPSSFAVGAGATQPKSLTFWNFLLFSAERFLNASPWIYGVSNWSHFLAVAETAFGVFCIGLLVAMLVRLVMRSS
ncbi:MAG: pentapeptide repeat-containing protein [Pseudolabrys sp.]